MKLSRGWGSWAISGWRTATASIALSPYAYCVIGVAAPGAAPRRRAGAVLLDLRLEPLVERALRLDRDVAAHRVVPHAAELRAHDLIRAFLVRGEPDVHDPAGHGVLLHPEVRQGQTVDDVDGRDVQQHGPVDDEMQVVDGDDVLFVLRIARVHPKRISRRDEPGRRPAEPAVGAGVAELPFELAPDDVDLLRVRGRRAVHLGPHHFAGDAEDDDPDGGYHRPRQLRAEVLVPVRGLGALPGGKPPQRDADEQGHRDEGDRGEDQDDVEQLVDASSLS